jgi:hypothetical protein
LPAWANEAKKRRKQLKILAFTQVAIFLALAAVFLFINTWEQRTEENSVQLSIGLAAFTPYAAEAAEALHQARLTAAEEDILLEMLPATFSKSYLFALPEATPESSFLFHISYRNNEILLTATTHYLDAAETHRTNLSQIFTNVWTGIITRVAEHTYHYELHIYTGEPQ